MTTSGARQHPDPPQFRWREIHVTRRDRIVSVLLALANMPVFAGFLLIAFLWGPEQFFGEYSRAAGHQAVACLVAVLLAAAAWGLFFASYARAGRANVLGFVALGAVAAVAAAILVAHLRSLANGRSDAGLDDPPHLGWLIVGAPLGWALVGACAGAALRRPGLRWVAVAPVALLGLGGFAQLASVLSQGGVALAWMPTVAAPLGVAFLLVDAVFPDKTRADGRLGH